MSRGFVLVLLLAGLGCDPPGRPNPSEQFRRPEDILDFTTLYRQHCAACHGVEGDLGPTVPLNDKLFLTIVPDDDLKDVIAFGRPGTPMAGFGPARGGPLTDPQVQVLALGLKKQWAPVEKPPGQLPAYELPKTSGQADLGMKVFTRACAECHGDDGRGGEGKRGGAIRTLAVLGLSSDQVLRRIIITGRPNLGFPTFAETVGKGQNLEATERDINNLVALLAAWRAEELPKK
jgi:mono/diheme cytochrome c family protein